MPTTLVCMVQYISSRTSSSATSSAWSSSKVRVNAAIADCGAETVVDESELLSSIFLFFLFSLDLVRDSSVTELANETALAEAGISAGSTRRKDTARRIFCWS